MMGAADVVTTYHRRHFFVHFYCPFVDLLLVSLPTFVQIPLYYYVWWKGRNNTVLYSMKVKCTAGCFLDVGFHSQSILTACFVCPVPSNCRFYFLHLQASSLELVFDTMTCLFQHLGSRAVPMLPFLGSVLHMLTYSLPAMLGPVGAAEDAHGDAEDQELDKEVREGASSAEPKSGAQATATYYAAVQVRHKSVRLIVVLAVGVG